MSFFTSYVSNTLQSTIPQNNICDNCRGTDLYVGNVGDSRCIGSIGGVAEALSVDHKPGDMLERARIENAGGFVEFNRVNGNLALSRAVGDFAFKNNTTLPPEDQV